MPPVRRHDLGRVHRCLAPSFADVSTLVPFNGISRTLSGGRQRGWQTRWRSIPLSPIISIPPSRPPSPHLPSASPDHPMHLPHPSLPLNMKRLSPRPDHTAQRGSTWLPVPQAVRTISLRPLDRSRLTDQPIVTNLITPIHHSRP